ncbi:MAG: ATP-binding protein [Anaerolineales bacterium]
MSFEDRLGLLADREADARDARRLERRLKTAKLRYPAAVEDIDFRTPRSLNRGVIASLAQAGWVTRGHNVLITGATGCGKSFVACALANAALRRGHTALYVRTPRLLEELARGRADSRNVRTLSSLARVSLLVLDDFLLSPAPVEACRAAGNHCCAQAAGCGPDPGVRYATRGRPAVMSMPARHPRPGRSLVPRGLQPCSFLSC